MTKMRTSVRYKLISLLLISIIVPIAASIVVTYFYTKESVKDRAIEENTRLLSEGKTNLTNYLEVINKASLILYSNTSLGDILSNGVADNKDRSNIYTALQLVSQAADNIYQVLLYLDKDQTAYLMYEGNFKSGQTKSPTNEAGIAPYAVRTIPTHRSNDYGIRLLPPNKAEQVFSVYRPLYRVPTTERIGMLAIDIKADALRKLSAQLYDSENEDLYILDESGTAVYASEESAIGVKLEQPWARTLLTQTAASGSLETNKSAYEGIILYDKITMSDNVSWTIVKRIPDRYLYEHARKLTLINTAIAVMFLIVATTAVLYVSIRFTYPIKKLIRSMNKIQTGQLEEPIDTSRQDEFGQLAKRFQMMMQTINDLIFQEYKLKLANKTNQLKMLQAQVNPHFLNNALQSIGASALDHDAPEVYGLVSSLGQMMHYSMNMKDTIVPLSQELDYVDHYLLLQRQRFGDKLKVEYAWDERAAAVPVPKMIVQPLVENYFKHGFHQSHRIGVLRIGTRLQDDTLRIVIEDNGRGIPEDRLTAIRHELSDKHLDLSGNGDRIGLLNVLFRLRLYCGDQAKLTLEGCRPQGLRITVTLPILHQEEITP